MRLAKKKLASLASLVLARSFRAEPRGCNLPPMQIGAKLRELRLAKNLSQGDIQKRTGLFRCYTSRVEHGHTVPSIETLEKYAHALEIPLYRLFTDEDLVKMPKLRQPKDDTS